MMKFIALATLLAFVVATVTADDDDKRSSLPAMSNRVIAQFLDRLPIYRGSAQKRFDVAMIPYDLLNDNYRVHKRNNAEVVNHILKNFGALDRLGDVGRR